MNARQKAALYTQLATLARAGVPLHQATTALRPYFGQSEMRFMIESIEAGQPLSAGMEQAGFKPFEIRMVVTGEQTGRIELIFQQLAEFWESEAHLKNSISRQLLYPVLLLHFAILAFPAGLLLTRPFHYLLSVAGTLALVYLALFLLFFFLYWSWRQPAGQKIILNLPLVGKTLRSAGAWRWIQVAEIEYSAGIPLPESIRDAWLATGWIHGLEAGDEAAQRLNQGENLSTLYAEWPELPPQWGMFLITGEKAGKLHESLAQLLVEARQNWQLTRKFLAEWLPRLFYAGILIFIGAKILSTAFGYFNEVNKLLDS